MQSCDREFFRRVDSLPAHGVGLSVDVFSPDLLELYSELDRAGLRPDYLEVFKAPSAELARIRQALPQTTFAYHAEGVWLIDPEMQLRYPWREQTHRMARHAQILGAAWINHECASKQFAGYSFGTYLPPLFTRASAEVTAANVALCQHELSRWYATAGSGDVPLLLLELPPLTYFGFGDLSPAEFFACIAQAAACGFVLDIGHLWTVWRYCERRRFANLESFADAFLEQFPLHRVVQVHLAGLASARCADDSDSPRWIDAHQAAVPGVLWKLLHQVLAHPGLTSLKAIALEVDTKAVPLIVEEFGELREHCGTPLRRTDTPREPQQPDYQPLVPNGVQELAELYRMYTLVVAGQAPLEGSGLEPLSQDLDRPGLQQYANEYLPNELLRWGGDVEDLFPGISRRLAERGVSRQDFVRFWFRRPCSTMDAYDFFYIKLDRWIEFVSARAPDLSEEIELEGRALRRLHAEFNDEPVVPSLATGRTD